MNQIERQLAVEAVEFAHKLNAELEMSKRAPGFALVVLAKAREEAVTAVVDLMNVDTQGLDVQRVRYLQNEIKRYVEMATWVRHTLMAGAESSEALRVAQEQAGAIEGDLEWSVKDEYEQQPADE